MWSNWTQCTLLQAQSKKWFSTSWSCNSLHWDGIFLRMRLKWRIFCGLCMCPTNIQDKASFVSLREIDETHIHLAGHATVPKHYEEKVLIWFQFENRGDETIENRGTKLLRIDHLITTMRHIRAKRSFHSLNVTIVGYLPLLYGAAALL